MKWRFKIIKDVKHYRVIKVYGIDGCTIRLSPNGEITVQSTDPDYPNGAATQTSIFQQGRKISELVYRVYGGLEFPAAWHYDIFFRKYFGAVAFLPDEVAELVRAPYTTLSRNGA